MSGKNAPARFKGDEPIPDLDVFPVEKVERVVADIVESFRATKGLADGTRSLQIRCWAKALEATVARYEVQEGAAA